MSIHIGTIDHDEMSGPLHIWRCDQCSKLHVDEYEADVCCGGQPSQRALEARGQQRLEGLEV